MNLFTILRHHVATQPNAIASRSSRRVVTYRKFWSRIERATARLKSEWNVKAGDTLVYWGQGHQDALMFYIAVARCGAKLLPLEHAPLHQDSVSILKSIPAVLLLHDDETIFEVPLAAPLIANLSSLIANRCHHNPPVNEDLDQPSLISLTTQKTGGMQLAEQSVRQLMEQAAIPIEPDGIQEFRVAEALFDAEIFAPRVLSTLIGGGTIVFR